MQSIVSLDTTDIYTDKKRPSTKLQEKIKTCVSMFRSLNETVNEVIEIGKSEGFIPKEIGQFIRQEMIKSGLSTRTVTRYLPAELKAKPRGLPVASKIKDKMSLNYSQSQPLTDDIEQFSMANRYLYKHEFLGKVIDHLAQIYNEKTGQKIKVIFRKMIEDGGTTKDKDKKYQPSPDEVKQRENKVLSLVEQGIVKISDLVEQSGVSESATRRYLQRAGYKVTFGTISR